MFIDAGELWSFYAAPLGHTVRRLLGTRLRARWRHIEGETLYGLGYASPLMGSFRGEASRIGSFMPAPQGALVWPHSGDSLTVLVDVENLPLPDASVDRLIVAHCLENAERVDPILREIWRVLAPEGRVVFIVPNRGGIWARTATTPFGFGRPYTRGQLERLLADAMLATVDCFWALHLPPVDRPLVLRSAVAIERLGARIWPSSAGVMLIEARKEVTSPIGKAARADAVRGLVTVPGLRPIQDGARARERRSIVPRGETQPSRRTDSGTQATD